VSRLSSQSSTPSSERVAGSASSWLVPGLPLLLCGVAFIIVIVIVVVYAVCVRGRYRWWSTMYSRAAQHGSHAPPAACQPESGNAAAETMQQAASQRRHLFTPTTRSQLPFNGFALLPTTDESSAV